MLKLNKISNYFTKIKDPRRQQLSIQTDFINLDDKLSTAKAKEESRIQQFLFDSEVAKEKSVELAKQKKQALIDRKNNLEENEDTVDELIEECVERIVLAPRADYVVDLTKKTWNKRLGKLYYDHLLIIIC